MPNAVCFLVAYALVLCLELGRWVGLSSRGKSWLMKLLVCMTALGLLTHTLYLMDRVFQSAASDATWRLALSWHDWGIMTAWGLAIAYAALLLRRSESWIGLFVLPLLLVLVGASIAVPSVPLNPASSASLWRIVHGVSMTLGTMLVSLGFAMAIMYLFQAWRLKTKRPTKGLLRLPSLEYLQSFGSTCLLCSAAAIGFGVASGVIMNLVQDGQVNWADRGIVFSGGLFLWLALASAVQWHFANKGRGHFTAWMNILSFVIVAIALYLVVSAPHGRLEAKQSLDSQTNQTPSGGDR
jgi:hypothetical protein